MRRLVSGPPTGRVCRRGAIATGSTSRFGRARCGAWLPENKGAKRDGCGAWLPENKGAKREPGAWPAVQVPGPKGVAILTTLATLDGDARHAIYQQARHEDSHERDKAIARAIGTAPPLDPGVDPLLEALPLLARAAKATRAADFIPRISATRQQLRELVNDLLRATGGHPVA